MLYLFRKHEAQYLENILPVAFVIVFQLANQPSQFPVKNIQINNNIDQFHTPF